MDPIEFGLMPDPAGPPRCTLLDLGLALALAFFLAATLLV